MLVHFIVLFIQLMNALSLGMSLFVIAAGLTLIFGVLRIVNFAHGAFYMVGAYLAYSVVQTFGETRIWVFSAWRAPHLGWG